MTQPPPGATIDARCLQPARLVRRYKRFLADMILDGGSEPVTVHCPNPGAMIGLDAPGTACLLAPGTGALPWRWVMAHADGDWVGIDASLPNKLVADALAAGRIPELAGYPEIKPEAMIEPGSRCDFRLTAPDRPTCWVEVKNAHLMRRPGEAEFPDCVTKRGAKHLRALAAAVARGDRAVLLFVVQRNDCPVMTLSADLDPAYCLTYLKTVGAGVETLAYACVVAPNQLAIDRPLAFRPPVLSPATVAAAKIDL